MTVRLSPATLRCDRQYHIFFMVLALEIVAQQPVYIIHHKSFWLECQSIANDKT